MEVTLVSLHLSSTCTRRPLTVPHPSSTPLYTIYAPTTKLEMLVKPMKNKEKYKTPKVSDKMLTSSIEHDIKTRFDNDATKKCISTSNPKPAETSLFRISVPRLGQKHTLTPEDAALLPPKTPRLLSLHASLDKSEGSFNRTCTHLTTAHRKIMSFTQGFPLFCEIVCMTTLSQYTA